MKLYSSARLIALGVGVVSILVLAEACGSGGDTAEPGTTVAATTAASGPGGGGGTGGAGTGGSGEGGSGGVSPFDAACTEICAEIEAIACQVWPNCEAECPDMFNAPADCADEYQILIDCWALHKDEFMCTQTQVLPPPSCFAEQEAFNECFGGGGQTDCMGQVCNSAETTCACKTSCLDSEFKSACTEQSSNWTCSCYDHDQLLGNCTETAENACENYLGCCADFFFPE